MRFPLLPGLEYNRIKKMVRRMLSVTNCRFVKMDVLGMSMVLDLWTIYGRRLSEGLSYEPQTTAFIQSLEIGDDKVCLDIGASHGLYSLLLSKKCREVFSFEPNQKTICLLDYNIRLNNCHNITSFECAVSDLTGSSRFYMSRDSSRDSFFPMQYAEKVDMVPTIRLDDWGMFEPDCIGLIKIDVEGSELKVLRGMRDTIEHNQSAYVIVEFIPRNQGFNAEELFDFFDGWSHRGLDWNMLFWREEES